MQLYRVTWESGETLFVGASTLREAIHLARSVDDEGGELRVRLVLDDSEHWSDRW